MSGDPSSTPTATVLLIDKQPTHWTLTLNRPEKRNALSSDLIEALLAAVQDAKAAQTPLLVLQGAGANFSAGFDFTSFEEQSESDLLLRFVRIEALLQEIAYGLRHARQRMATTLARVSICLPHAATAGAPAKQIPHARFEIRPGFGHAPPCRFSRREQCLFVARNDRHSTTNTRST